MLSRLTPLKIGNVSVLRLISVALVDNCVELHRAVQEEKFLIYRPSLLCSGLLSQRKCQRFYLCISPKLVRVQ